MTIEAQFDRIATALEGIAKRIDALGAAIAAMNGGTTATTTGPTFVQGTTATTGPTFVQGTDISAAILAEAAPLKEALATATPAEEVLTAPLAPEPKKRGRPALKAVETATEPSPLAPEPATEDAVKTAILAFAGKRGKQAAIDILSRHGAARVRDLDPSTYGAVLADIAKG